MKSSYIIVLFIILLASGCKKMSAGPEEQEIIISINGVQSGDFTKVGNSEINNLISSLFPTSEVTFTLASTSNSDRVYTVKLGEAIILPIDVYNVTAYYRPTTVGTTVKNGCIYKTPRFYIETTISVNKDQKNYTVDAIYECWALIIDYSVCTKYRHLGYSYVMEDFTYFYNSSNLGIAFIYGSWTTQPYTIKAYPKENSGYESVSYDIVTDRNYTGTLVEYGKWYLFSPNAVEDSSGSININFPSWTNGQ